MAGYEKTAVWYDNVDRVWKFGGFFVCKLTNIKMKCEINAEKTRLTVTVLDWDFSVEDPESDPGDGFVDYVGFAWYDEPGDRDDGKQTYFYPRYFTYAGGNGSENPQVAYGELSSITSGGGLKSGYPAQTNTCYEENTFFWAWQGNEGRRRYLVKDNVTTDPKTRSHTWKLTPNDFNEDGSLKNKTIFCSYQRHLDHVGNMPGWESDPNQDDWDGWNHWPSEDPCHSHWLIDTYYHIGDEDFPHFNWKFHPWAIRKNNDWMSCNRINDRSNQSKNGHLAIKKNDRWNAVWNDDMREISVDEAKRLSNGVWSHCPRLGNQANDERYESDNHEWEDWA